MDYLYTKFLLAAFHVPPFHLGLISQVVEYTINPVLFSFYYYRFI